MNKTVSKSTLQRLPIYLNYLSSLRESKSETISSTMLANALGLGEVQVRKDLASITDKGKPRIGYFTDELIGVLKDYLGLHDVSEAVIVGVGRLGQALMSYKGFEEYGLNIVAGFDINPKLIDSEVNSKKVYHLKSFQSVVDSLGVKIGIITLPKENAQQIADLMVKVGIRAIWNFSPTHIIVPKTVAIKNENMASGLAVLSNQLKELLNKE